MGMLEGIDKRQFPRVKYNCLINITQKGVRKSISAKTENIGGGGLCVIISEPVDVFSKVGIELFLQDNQPPISCSGDVVWVVKQKDLRVKKLTTYDVGIEFTDIKPQDKQRIAAVVGRLIK